MKLYHIAAFSENRVIGKDNDIPWKNRDDMRRFAEITRGHPIIMGMKTFASMGKKPLPGRRNVVLTRSDTLYFDGRPLSFEDGPITVESDKPKTSTVFCQTIEDALMACMDKNEVFIIGGGAIYEQTQSMVDELRITVIHSEIEEDDTTVFYPEIDEDHWQIAFTEAHETHSYVDYVRRT